MRGGGGRAEGLKFRLLTHSLVAPWWVDHIDLGCSYFHLPLEFHSLVIKMLDWKLVDDIQTLLCLYLCFKSLLQKYTFYGIKIMTEHEYWLLFPITVTLTLTTKSTHQQLLTTKMRSKLQKLHHRTRPFSVLCALRNFSTSWILESTGGARAAASCWDFFLVAGDGNHSNLWKRTSPWHAAMSWHQQKQKTWKHLKKTVKS